MSEWTEAKLKAMSVHHRHQLWKNASTKTSAEAKELVARIESLGLPFSEAAALKSDDPLLQKIIEIINTSEAKAAAVMATEAGLPALAGIDPILRRELGVDYGAHNRGTLEAGFWVADMMRSQGYTTTDIKKKMPEGSVAKTAEFYAPNKKIPQK